jgi:hypothetical protein
MSQKDLDLIEAKRAYKRQWYINNRQRLLTKAKSKYDATPEFYRKKSLAVARANPQANRDKVNNWRRENPERARDSQLKKNYGITLDAYIKIFESQNNRCAICKSPSTGGKNDWHVDHDHSTGKVRGILCNHCNRGLGAFKDNASVLTDAINYLTQF